MSDRLSEVISFAIAIVIIALAILAAPTLSLGDRASDIISQHTDRFEGVIAGQR